MSIGELGGVLFLGSVAIVILILIVSAIPGDV